MQSVVVWTSCLVAWCLAVTSSGQPKCKDIITYNMGLIPNLPAGLARRNAAAQALKQSGGDFVCLQEVWFEEDLSSLLEDVKSVYPYHYSKIHHGVGQLRRKPCKAELKSALKDTPCTRSEAGRLGQAIQKCAIQKGCTTLGAVQQGVCILLQCADILRSGIASENCISCITVHQPKPMSVSLPSCTQPKAVHNRLNNPGIVVLSKTPITGVSYNKYFPHNKMTFERGFIQATLNDGKLAACTHLSSKFPFYPEYDLSFGSYAEQHKAEMRVLNETFYDVDHFLLGDMNAGPKVDSADPEKNLTGEFPDNYNMLLGLGYQAPYLASDGRCTTCAHNLLRGNNNDNQVIDQVLVYNNAYTTNFPTRVFDTQKVGGLPLSDHFGVKVQVCDV